MNGQRYAIENDRRTPQQKWVSGALSVLSVVFAALLLSTLITTFFVHTVLVEGPSMNHTLHDGQTVWVTKVFKIKRGDIVIFDCDDKFFPAMIQGKTLIKRVVGLPGDTIYRADNGSDYTIMRRQADGSESVVAEDFKKYGPGADDDNLFTDNITVPEGMVYVMGDNHNNSEDSTNFGPFDSRFITGKALFVR